MGKSRRKSRSLAGRGSILLISALLIGSAGMRVAIGASAAIAEGELGVQLVLPSKPADHATPPTQNRAEMQSLLDALKDREEKVAERESMLDMRAKALDVAQVEIVRRLDALEIAEQRLGATLAHAETAAEDDLARLTTVYENMKPKDAALLFGAMEADFAAGFLARMRPDAAAKIMSGLDPQAAYSISAILAGRNARAPKS